LGTQTGLKNEDGQNTAIYVNQALRQLTHIYAEQGLGGSSIPDWHTRWQNWWLASGPTATIDKPDASVADTQLP
jgi:hypothetical protein